MEGILNIAIAAARKAGRTIRGQTRHVPPLSVGFQGQNEYVRRLNVSVYRTIASSVELSFPEHRVVLATEQRSKPCAQTVWIVDPLNGRQNFLRNIDHHCTIIGIEENRVMRHALIIDHMRDEEFVVSRGEGAQKSNNRIRVSGTNTLSNAIIGLDDCDARIHPALMNQDVHIRQSGCIGLDLAYLSCGRIDACAIDEISSFFTDVARLFLLEAGGFASSLIGGEWLSSKDGLVAANPQLHRKLVTLLRNKSILMRDTAEAIH